MVVSTLGSALAAYFVWGFAHNAGILYLFAVVFGSISGAFSSSTAPAGADLTSQNIDEESMIMGLFGIYKAIAIIGGPLICSVLHHKPTGSLHSSTSIPWYGGFGFTKVIIFVGSTLAVTGAGCLLNMLLRTRRVRG